MDIEDEEILNLLKLLDNHKVQYIMVGGFAMIIYNSVSRFTANIEIWIKDTPLNRRNLYNALVDLGLSIDESFQRIDFVPGWSTIYLSSGMELDIMAFLKGLPQEKFDECYNLAVTSPIHGITVHFLHLNHLPESKKASRGHKIYWTLQS